MATHFTYTGVTAPSGTLIFGFTLQVDRLEIHLTLEAKAGGAWGAVVWATPHPTFADGDVIDVTGPALSEVLDRAFGLLREHLPESARRAVREDRAWAGALSKSALCDQEDGWSEMWEDGGSIVRVHIPRGDLLSALTRLGAAPEGYSPRRRPAGAFRFPG